MKFESLPDDVILAKALSVLRSIFGDQTVPEVSVCCGDQTVPEVSVCCGDQTVPEVSVCCLQGMILSLLEPLMSFSCHGHLHVDVTQNIGPLPQCNKLHA